MHYWVICEAAEGFGTGAVTRILAVSISAAIATFIGDIILVLQLYGRSMTAIPDAVFGAKASISIGLVPIPTSSFDVKFYFFEIRPNVL